MERDIDIVNSYQKTMPFNGWAAACDLGIIVDYAAIGPDITIKHIPGRYVATLKNGLSPAKMRLAHCVVVAFYILARDLLKEGQTQAIQLHSAEDPNAGPLSPYHVEMCLRHALRLLVPPARIRRLIAEAGPGEDLVSRAAETFGITRAAARIFLSRHGADAVAEETMPA